VRIPEEIVKPFAMLCMVCLAPLVSAAQSKQFDSKPLEITDVTVIDTTGAAPKPGQTVIVEGNRISQVGDAKKVHAPKGAQVVNARGLFVIPGLWDMHVHVWETDRTFPLFIANGVLGVRNMGGHLDDLKRWRAQVVSGELLGPHMVISGPLIDGLNPAHPDHSIVAHDPAEGRASVDSLKQSGVDFISVFDNLTPDEYSAIAEESKKVGLPFAGHLPQGVWASDASTIGQLSIEHLLGSLEESSKNFDQILHLNDSPPASPAERSARALALLKLEVDGYDPERLKNLAALFAKNGTWQVPTLLASKVSSFLNDDAVVKNPLLAYVGQKDRKEWIDIRDHSIKDNPPDYWALHRAAYQEELAITREYHHDGVSILGGTDAGGPPFVIPGFDLHNELAALVDAGFTPLEALQSVTLDAAKFLGRADDFGTVANGKAADFVLLDANPLDDIHNTQKIRAVVVQGKYLDRAALDTLLAHAKELASH
jgi:imidazolonepropionase-like amidohydrolase